MKKIVLFMVFFTLLALEVYAAQIYGALKGSGGQPLADTDITVSCGGNSYTAKTDKSGSYSLYAKVTGKCSFKISYRGKEVSADVFSYENAVRYDFDVVDSNGNYSLRRK